MSCLDKLTYFPPTQPFDSNIRTVCPSIIEDMSLKAKNYYVLNVLDTIQPQIKLKIGNKLNLYLDIAVGNAIGNVLQGQSFSSAFNSSIIGVRTQLLSHYSAIDSLIACELNAASSDLTNTTETNNLQTNMLQPAVDSITSLSNSSIKNLTENPVASNNLIDLLTTNTVAAGLGVITTAMSNNSQASIQASVISAIETL
jgi:hypothetical protein